MASLLELPSRPPRIVRYRLRVTGVVQGVGFRPFMHRLATELGLSGWVRNDAAGVEAELQGAPAALGECLRRLRADAPPLARIDDVDVDSLAARADDEAFHILPSVAGPARTVIGPDAAVCPQCLAELFDPADRRWRYAFINCTHCGPRYTITRALPYDRPNTSMAGFSQCPSCRTEYGAPSDRRFHAEPNACPACGPRLRLLAADGSESAGADPIADTLQRLRAGQIVALKGLGGYHLACDAGNAAAVARLRERKQREEKPFAVMVANVLSARHWAEVGGDEAAALESAERPIVLLRKAPTADTAMPGVAPGIAWLGVMLPYTPLHWLLFHEAAGRPAGTAWMERIHGLALVMTSANPGGEPLVTGDDEALQRLAGIADALLVHDRDIVVRCDDSVVRLAGHGPGRRDAAAPWPSLAFGVAPFGFAAPAYPLTHPFAAAMAMPFGASLPAFPPFPLMGAGDARSAAADPVAPGLHFIRRARGYTPAAIRLAGDGPSVLAWGGWFKNTVCLTRGGEAFVSQHIGDLDNAPARTALHEVVDHLCAVLDVHPAVVAHDLHPDYHSSRAAAEWAAARGLPLVAVQHHHAHVAAVLAEHRHDAPALGLALDGVGLGSDGGQWGGELLRVDGARCERLAHLRPLPLPGGDRAAREPWRMAAAALHALGRGDEVGVRFAHQPGASTVARMLDARINCPPTSSMGRWFDAAAGMLGVREVMAFEGQAAMLLEGLAHAHGSLLPRHELYRIDDAGGLDLLPLLGELARLSPPGRLRPRGEEVARGAALFHATLAAALDEWVWRAARLSGLRTVALAGGCFLNHVLGTALGQRLRSRGLTVLEAHAVPPNDGGLSLGQAWVARQATV